MTKVVMVMVVVLGHKPTMVIALQNHAGIMDCTSAGGSVLGGEGGLP